MFSELRLQTEAPSAHILDEIALPVCLFENPHRLVSLWDMQQIAAHNVVHVGRVLQSMQLNPALRLDSEYPAPGDVKRFIEEMAAIKHNCDQLKLSCTSGIVDFVIGEYKNNRRTYGQVGATVEYVSATFQQELSRQMFAYIEPDKAKH